MPDPVPSPWQVPFDGRFRLSDVPTRPPDDPGKRACQERLEKATERIDELQRMLYAEDRHSLLLVFQAMDAAGKDGTIRAVLSGVNPAGCHVSSFKAPSAEELQHDFLWRTTRQLPERGRIGVFNRSYYEEVLIVRVHPHYRAAQNLPEVGDDIWAHRYESIRSHERHLERNGMVILKFFLNVSKEEQRERFLSRLEEPHKHWKFNPGDVKERGHWDAYMSAYEAALRETSREWAPWYAIPADDKPYMRMAVAELVVGALERLNLAWPTVAEEDRARFGEMRKLLDGE